LQIDDRTSLIVFALLAFTSGAGILFSRWLPSSADLWVPESSLFLTLGETPHFVFSLPLLWLGITGFYAAASGRCGFWIPLLTLAILWWEHPYDAVILCAVTGANIWQLSRSKAVQYIVGGALVSLPPVLYYYHLRSIPTFQTWEAQNILASPPILS